jgi:hypothetical protein
MKRKTWLIICFSLAAFGVYAVMTGGLAASSVSDFSGQRDIRLVDGLQADVWLAPESVRFGVPLLFHYYGAGKPFGLRLQIWDHSRRYRAVEITEVVVEYKDGEVVRRSDVWSRRLKPHTQYNSSSSGVTQTEMFMLSDQMERLVLRHADVKITLRGQLVDADGKRVAFEASESFEAESRSVVAPFWYVLAAC